MRVAVTPFRKNGISLKNSKLKIYHGEIDMQHYLHPVLGRTTRDVSLYSESEKNSVRIIPSIHDVVLDNISANGFILRGYEYCLTKKGQAEFTQEWFVRPTEKEESK